MLLHKQGANRLATVCLLVLLQLGLGVLKHWGRLLGMRGKAKGVKALIGQLDQGVRRGKRSNHVEEK